MNASQRRNLEQCRAIAETHGGKCLSRRFETRDTRMSWQCAIGHRWTATAAPILRLGVWCPTCGHERRARRLREETFASVRAIARKLGGICLSERYDSSQAKLDFRCARGHQWSTTPGVIHDGSWCKSCSLREASRPLREKKFRSVQALARKRGGRCLTTTYVDAHTPMLWRCAEGHEWQTTAHAIDRTWCPRCAGVAKHTLEEMQQLARIRGGKCLSTVYVDAAAPMRWSCAAGHRWWANASNVMHQGNWCPRCRGMPRDDLARLRRIARRHGGQCLSTEYAGTTTPLLWRCRKGHEWSTAPHHVVSGSWCWICRRSTGPRPVLSLDDMKATAAARGGLCLSKQYFNVVTHMRWQCARGHRWKAVAAAIRSGTWCPRCSHAVRGTIDGLAAHAAQLGGRCLSSEYDDPRRPLQWQCAKGHRFEALAKVVKTGVWCPRCR
jgi:hypothetical protein